MNKTITKIVLLSSLFSGGNFLWGSEEEKTIQEQIVDNAIPGLASQGINIENIPEEYVYLKNQVRIYQAAKKIIAIEPFGEGLSLTEYSFPLSPKASGIIAQDFAILSSGTHGDTGVDIYQVANLYQEEPTLDLTSVNFTPLASESGDLICSHPYIYSHDGTFSYEYIKEILKNKTGHISNGGLSEFFINRWNNIKDWILDHTSSLGSNITEEDTAEARERHLADLEEEIQKIESFLSDLDTQAQERAQELELIKQQAIDDLDNRIYSYTFINNANHGVEGSEIDAVFGPEREKIEENFQSGIESIQSYIESKVQEQQQLLTKLVAQRDIIQGNIEQIHTVDLDAPSDASPVSCDLFVDNVYVGRFTNNRLTILNRTFTEGSICMILNKLEQERGACDAFIQLLRQIDPYQLGAFVLSIAGAVYTNDFSNTYNQVVDAITCEEEQGLKQRAIRSLIRRAAYLMFPVSGVTRFIASLF